MLLISTLKMLFYLCVCWDCLLALDVSHGRSPVLLISSANRSKMYEISGEGLMGSSIHSTQSCLHCTIHFDLQPIITHCVSSCKRGNPYAMLLIMPFCSDFVTITSTMYNNGDQLSSRTLVCIPPCLSILTANSIALYLSTE